MTISTMTRLTVPLPDGVDVLGFQGDGKGGGTMLYHDHVTRSTFACEGGETVAQAQQRKHREFGLSIEQAAAKLESNSKYSVLKEWQREEAINGRR